jgi:hypothetical protein
MEGKMDTYVTLRGDMENEYKTSAVNPEVKRPI